MHIYWTDHFDTGNALVDEHHKGIFDKINELFDAVERGEEKGALQSLIISFESFLISHFALEEALQLRCGYSEYAAHSNQHLQLAHEFSGLRKLSEREDTVHRFAVIGRDFLKDWFETYMAHLNMADRQLADFLKARM